MTPGIHAISAADYHSDPCDEPSLSSSIASILCQSSPAHARAAHKRLNPQAEDEEAVHFDIGTAAHAMLLEGEAAVTVVQANDWRTNIAKAARDAARAQGKIPLLAKVWDDVQVMVASTRDQLAHHADGKHMFLNGAAEQTLIWQEDGVWCRARLDWLRPGACDDYKSTSKSANPETVSRTLFASGWDIQAQWYRRGVKALTGQDVEFRFCVQETYAPFALSVVALGPDVQVLADKKIMFALDAWRQCLKTGKWPAYPHQTCWASLPAWEEARWLAIETA